MKKLFVIGVSAFALFLSSNVFAATKVSNQNVVLDGKTTNVKGYNIKENNYFKLRDIAALLEGTDEGFDVNYHEGTNTIHISRKSDYNRISDDLKPLKDTESNPINSPQNVFVDGQKVSFNAYSIDGYNYFKLRELGRVVGFLVEFDEEDGKVIIDTTRKLTPRPLVNNLVKLDVIGYAAGSYEAEQDIVKKGELDITDFFKNIESGLILTSNEGRVSAESYYIKEDNVVMVHPIQAKFSGTFKYTPFIRIRQGNKEDVFRYNDKFEVAKTLKSKGFDPTGDFEISLGTKSDDGFIVYSTFVYK